MRRGRIFWPHNLFALEPHACKRDAFCYTMATNVSREKLLFYAAAGGLGGLAAWGLSETILGIRWVYGRDILFGALIGALISAFLASIETLSVGQIRQAA